MMQRTVAPSKYLEPYLGRTSTDDLEVFCSAQRKVDQSPFFERTAVIDANDDRSRVGQVGNADLGAEWERPVRRREGVHVEAFTVGRLLAVKIVGIV